MMDDWGRWMTDDGWRMTDDGRQMTEDDGWRMMREDGGGWRKAEDDGWQRMTDVRRWITNDGWRLTEDGGWRMKEDNGWRMTKPVRFNPNWVSEAPAQTISWPDVLVLVCRLKGSIGPGCFKIFTKIQMKTSWPSNIFPQWLSQVSETGRLVGFLIYAQGIPFLICAITAVIDATG